MQTMAIRIAQGPVGFTHASALVSSSTVLAHSVRSGLAQASEPGDPAAADLTSTPLR